MAVDAAQDGLTSAETAMKTTKTSEEISQEWLREAQFKEILSSDISHRTLFVLLTHPNGEIGVLIAEKKPFSEKQADIVALLKAAQLKEIMKNDIFGSYEVSVPSELNLIKSQLIFPANEKLVAKYRQEEKFVVRETPEYYERFTKPYIEQYQLNLTWVYNFLSKKAEAERIVFEDVDAHNGFILAPDIKWDGKTLETLYLLAIVNRRGVKSIRDLTADDLPLLENMRRKGLEAIQTHYGVRPDQIRMYFHYQPSFYHLHVHFVHLKFDAPASCVLSAVLLDDVINNLRICGDFYKKATLTFTRKNSDKLLEMYRQGDAVEFLNCD